MKIYAEDGSRIPFSPEAMQARLPGCLLCGAPVSVIGVFTPQSSEMRAAVLRLRTHAVVPRSTPGLVYGLCQRCAADRNALDSVEAAIKAAAAKVAIQ